VLRFEQSSHALRAINLANFCGIEAWRSQAPDPVNLLCVLGVLSAAGGWGKIEPRRREEREVLFGSNRVHQIKG